MYLALRIAMTGAALVALGIAALWLHRVEANWRERRTENEIHA